VRLTLNYLSFVLTGMVFGLWHLRGRRPDAIFVYAPSPLLQALPALLIGWVKRAPVILHVQDLWPESLQATGYVKSRFILAMVERLVGFIYRKSNMILISSRPFEGAIRRFLPTGKVIYYPNSVSSSFCDPESGPRPEVLALNDGFSVVFAGNIGSAQAVAVIVEAARRLALHEHIRFVVIGSGSELAWMTKQKEALGLENLCFAGRFPPDAMPYLLSKASVLLVTLADHPIFSMTVPNKIQAYMAVGRPIIACMNGEGARLIEEAGAGLAVPAEDGGALADAILRLYRMPPADRKALAANARAYYHQHFDHENLVSDLIGHLSEARKAKA
jgi:glycosyltransferase involved in cell wall biosynthesis